MIKQAKQVALNILIQVVQWSNLRERMFRPVIIPDLVRVRSN